MEVEWLRLPDTVVCCCDSIHPVLLLCFLCRSDDAAGSWITLAAGEAWKDCCVFPLNRVSWLEADDEAWKVSLLFRSTR
ncbi:hypothetical protein Nepgr_016417 [Nepenthes gracilis]|uniref:Uncharacterized protein n=1 Tax=Nepenthes gracilis TaxID=150966 RepID=A0AAD3SQA3_NEPGR|nr:hypothetical protein Nepgr_016417 [Nepenthes gracilis]